MSNIKYKGFLTVGLVQTTLDRDIAWSDNRTCNIDNLEGERVWQEVIKGVKNIHNNGESPEVIIFPELTITRNNINKFCKLTNSVNAILIAGLDYNVDKNSKSVLNEMIVVSPSNWPNKFGYGFKKVILGKYNYARLEEKIINDRGYIAEKNPYIYVFDSDEYGRIGVAICADFFDIERFVVYKGQIQHLFISAYNQDISSFYFLAEAISRLVFCNVIICNTGYYGGSIVFSPYNESYKRYIYKHEGASLFTSQSVKVPVKSLIEAQLSDDDNRKLGKDRFKYKPPGYTYHSNRQILKK